MINTSRSGTSASKTELKITLFQARIGIEELCSTFLALQPSTASTRLRFHRFPHRSIDRTLVNRESREPRHNFSLWLRVAENALKTIGNLFLRSVRQFPDKQYIRFRPISSLDKASPRAASMKFRAPLSTQLHESPSF